MKGTTKYTNHRLENTEILKETIRDLYKEEDNASYREIKELTPIENKIERIRQMALKKKE